MAQCTKETKKEALADIGTGQVPRALCPVACLPLGTVRAPQSPACQLLGLGTGQCSEVIKVGFLFLYYEMDTEAWPAASEAGETLMFLAELCTL